MKVEHQSIFGDTYHGIPNPNRALQFKYPSRYHGPDYAYPVFDHTYRVNPYQVPLQQSPLGDFFDKDTLGTLAILGIVGIGIYFLAK